MSVSDDKELKMVTHLLLFCALNSILIKYQNLRFTKYRYFFPFYKSRRRWRVNRRCFNLHATNDKKHVKKRYI